MHGIDSGSPQISSLVCNPLSPLKLANVEIVFEPAGSSKTEPSKNGPEPIVVPNRFPWASITRPAAGPPLLRSVNDAKVVKLNCAFATDTSVPKIVRNRMMRLVILRPSLSVVTFRERKTQSDAPNAGMLATNRRTIRCERTQFTS